VREQAALADRQLSASRPIVTPSSPSTDAEVDGAPQHRAAGLVPAPDPAVGGCWLVHVMELLGNGLAQVSKTNSTIVRKHSTAASRRRFPMSAQRVHPRPWPPSSSPASGGTPEDEALLGEFLSRLSPARRTRGSSPACPACPSRRLLAALLPEPPEGGALLGFLDGELVGHGLWVRLADPTVAEIALVVADTHQRRGSVRRWPAR
jgi:hypothetical protein